MLMFVLTQSSCTSYSKEDIDYVIRDIIGECYQVRVDSFIYSIHQCESADNCYGIQSYTDKGASNKHNARPYSHEQVLTNVEFWNDAIDSYPSLPGLSENKYIGSVLAGTEFEFVDIDYRNIPGYRKYWAAEVVLLNGEFKNYHVRIPDQSHFQIYPPWTISSSFVNGPAWNDKYISECDKG